MVITKRGLVVFRADEVDSDGEIPAPFCYMKNKDSLGLGQHGTANMFGPNGMRVPNVVPVDEQDEEDELIEKEFQRIRGAAATSGPGAGKIPGDYPASERSMRSDEFDYADQQAAPSKLIQKMGKRPQLYNPNDEDFITNVQKPMRPKTKQEYLRQIRGNREKDSAKKAYPQRMVPQIVQEQSSAPPGEAGEAAPATMGETFFGKMNQTIGEGDLGQGRGQQPAASRQLYADRTDEIGVELADRPKPGEKARKSQQKKKRILRAEQRRLLVKDDSEATARRIRQREQQILEGMERFQEMLRRYPMQPKQQRGSNTLANKNLERVYGKIKQQYTRTVQMPDKQESNAGGLQTPSQFRDGLQGRAGYNINRSSRIGTNYSQSSLLADLAYPGPATAGLPSSGKPSLRLVHRATSVGYGLGPSPPDKLKGLAQIYQPTTRSKLAKGRGLGSNASLRS